MELSLRLPISIYGKTMHENSFLGNKLKENPENQYVSMSAKYPHARVFCFRDEEMRQLFVDVLYRYNFLHCCYTERYNEKLDRYEDYFISINLTRGHIFYLRELYPYDHGMEYELHGIERTLWPQYEELLKLTRHQQCEWFLKNYDYDLILSHLKAMYEEGSRKGLAMIRFTNFRKVIEDEFEGKRDETLHWNR